MEYRVLGPLEVVGGDGPLPLGGHKQRALLALLLLHENRVVTRERLIDQLWGDEPPETAVTTVQVYVSRLRKVLPEATLLTRPGGYVLEVEPESVDVSRFERLLADARRAQPARASLLLREALALWRGSALAEFEEPFARVEGGRLEDLRLGALEERIEADLALGRDAELIGELEALIAEQPHRERLRGQLMVALYRSGRQVDALAAYKDARRESVDELGIEPGAELKQIERRILAQDATLLLSPLTLRRTNLPVPATPFLGRDHERSELTDLLRDGMRLLTLTGPGGSGKTRLALQAAAAVSEQFPDGVCWVPLASLRDPALVLVEVARVLDIDQPGRDVAEVLREALAGKRLLLLLDNAEHLLPDAAAAVALLRDAGGPTLLVTSRERLQLAGEHVYSVAPLTKPDGLALFTLRARAVSPGFEPDDSVEELCARLDCLPLAIELAAACTPTLSPEQILQRLSQRFDLLKGGRDADPRQRTLRSTIEWSHDLLSPEERRLFARLAVFAGGCTLEAAEEICDADLDALGGLVDKSLVRRRGGRFWMLETIREYAAERLNDSEDAETFRRLHAGYFERFAAEAEQAMRGHSVGTWFDRVEQELPNLRIALHWSLQGGEPAAALRASTALDRFWQARSPTEGRAWLERSLATGAGTTAERGAASLRAALPALLQGDAERAVTLSRDAIELARTAGDDETHAAAHGSCALMLAEHGDHEQAQAMVHECRRLASGLDDPWTRAEALALVPAALTAAGDRETADALSRELLAIRRALGDEWRVAIILNNTGFAASLSGAYDEARSSLEECLGIALRLRAGWVTHAFGNLGLVALFQGRYGDALSLLGEGLQLANSRGDRRNGAEVILGLAATHAALGNLELAAKLDAIGTTMLDATGIGLPAALLDRLEPHLRLAREQTDPRTVAALGAPALTLSMDTAIAQLERHDSQATTATHATA